MRMEREAVDWYEIFPVLYETQLNSTPSHSTFCTSVLDGFVGTEGEMYEKCSQFQMLRSVRSQSSDTEI